MNEQPAAKPRKPAGDAHLISDQSEAAAFLAKPASHGPRPQALGRPKALVHKIWGNRHPDAPAHRPRDLYGSISRTFGMKPYPA